MYMRYNLDNYCPLPRPPLLCFVVILTTSSSTHGVSLSCHAILCTFFWRKGKGSLGLEEEAAEAKNRLLALPSRNVNTVYFGCCVAAVAKTWSTTGIHFLSAKATHPVKGERLLFHGSMCTCVCKSICIFKVSLSLVLVSYSWVRVLIMCYSICWQNLDETSFFTLCNSTEWKKRQHFFCYVLSDKIALW